ncbi:MAG TPA: hypothetical protein VHR39_20915 [Propionibacteriaceae bacterium]|nr:hypothetical protein [Propionibacteriaceae bacterium]
MTFFTAVLLGSGDAVVAAGDGAGVVAATCVGVGFSGAVSCDAPALHDAAADATTKAPATATTLRRTRTGATISLTITPSADIGP